MPFQIIRNDITKVKADAIVNTANPEPVFGNGTDKAIYLAAGAEKLLAERKKIGRLRVGETAVTPAFDLPAKYIIHTVGPKWQGGDHGETEDLAFCYRKPLLIAEQLGCESIAFPLIAAGVYGFPKEKALSVAFSVISDFLKDSEMEVTLTVFGEESFRLSSALTENVRQYIDEKYVSERELEEYGPGGPQADRRRGRRNLYYDQADMLYGSVMEAGAPVDSEYADEMPADSDDTEEASIYGGEPYDNAYAAPSCPAPSHRDSAADKTAAPVHGSFKKGLSKKGVSRKGLSKKELSDRMLHVGDTFQERLFRLIDVRGLTDAEVYKKANLSRKLFSKIRCSSEYSPAKRTAVALAVALELDPAETEDLLRRAGLALSPSSKFDLIVEYCIAHRIYDIFEINALLFEYDQPLLGC